MGKRFSIIIPVLRETAVINALLDHLRTLSLNEQCEMIVVDGSKTGDTLAVIAAGDVICLASPCGRARQMNAGAAVAVGDILLFLHADTRLPADALLRIGQALQEKSCLGGAFDLAIDSEKWLIRLIARVASLRSRFTRIPYGDQAIFIRRDFFRELGGYPDIPLFEDVTLMRQIKKKGAPLAILAPGVVTSSRRWEREGPLYVTLRNWLLLAAYYLGISPKKLVKFYEKKGSGDDD